MKKLIFVAFFLVVINLFLIYLWPVLVKEIFIPYITGAPVESKNTLREEAAEEERDGAAARIRPAVAYVLP